MSKNETTKSKIPKFTDRAAEAEFWDSHDFGDFWEETAPANVEFANNLTENLTVRLSASALALLRREAGQKGIGPSTLARMWIIEHLRQSQEANKN